MALHRRPAPPAPGAAVSTAPHQCEAGWLALQGMFTL
jgi:hypothetical protein